MRSTMSVEAYWKADVEQKPEKMTPLIVKACALLC